MLCEAIAYPGPKAAYLSVSDAAPPEFSAVALRCVLKGQALPTAARLIPLQNYDSGVAPSGSPMGDRMTKVTMYTKTFCGYCMAAKRFLNNRGIEF